MTPETFSPQQPEIEKTESENTQKSPEIIVEPDMSNEQLAEHAVGTISIIEQQSSEISSSAETSIASASKNVGASPETVATVRAEQGVDGQLAELKIETSNLAEGAKSEIKAAMIEDDKNQEQEIARNPNESHASYLERASDLTTSFLEKTRGKFFDPNRLRESDLTESEKTYITQVMNQAEAKPGDIENESYDPTIALTRIEQSIGTHSFPHLAGKNKALDESAFDKTARNRKLFEIQPGTGAVKRETYWNTLFFPYNTEATRAVAKKLFNNKTIVLLGGGHSRLREEMEQNDIFPREVVNVDPFVSAPESGADAVVPISAADNGFLEALRAHGIEKADEILAEYSVPAYLDEPEAVKQLIQNIDSLLAEGGSARIWPTEVKGSSNEVDVKSRKSALMESLAELSNTGNYEIIPRMAAGRPGFTLHKISRTKAG